MISLFTKVSGEPGPGPSSRPAPTPRRTREQARSRGGLSQVVRTERLERSSADACKSHKAPAVGGGCNLFEAGLRLLGGRSACEVTTREEMRQ